VDAWWATTLIVEYEKARGAVEKDGLVKGYNICVTKSVSAQPAKVYEGLLGWLSDSFEADLRDGWRVPGWRRASRHVQAPDSGEATAFHVGGTGAPERGRGRNQADGSRREDFRRAQPYSPAGSCGGRRDASRVGAGVGGGQGEECVKQPILLVPAFTASVGAQTHRFLGVELYEQPSISAGLSCCVFTRLGGGKTLESRSADRSSRMGVAIPERTRRPEPVRAKDPRFANHRTRCKYGRQLACNDFRRQDRAVVDAKTGTPLSTQKGIRHQHGRLHFEPISHV
jgi:hypothetical protein